MTRHRDDPQRTAAAASGDLRRREGILSDTMARQHGGDVQALRALRTGARAYLSNSLLQKELLDTMRDVHAGRKGVGQDVAAQLSLSEARSTDTSRTFFETGASDRTHAVTIG